MKTYPFWWEDYKPHYFKNCSIQNQFYDLVVIGSGYTGVCAAKKSISKNFKTLLIDQYALGEGASTRSAGMISGGLNLGKKINLFQEYGTEMAKEFVNESIDSYRHLENLISGCEDDVFFKKTGRLVLAHSKKKLFSLKQKSYLLNSFTKLNINILDDISDELPSEYYKGGMLVNDAASIHPSLFYKFLLDKIKNIGLDIYSPCKLISYKKIQDHYLINTSEGQIKSKYIMLATNGYSNKEIGTENYNIIGLPSYIAVSNEIGPEKILKLMPNLRMYSDSKNDLYYFRPTHDYKRLLFGAFPIWSFGKEKSIYVKNFFHSAIRKILPTINDFSIEYIWGGKVGVTFNSLPQVKLQDNKIFVFGCNGSGVALMPYLGDKAVNLIDQKLNSQFIMSKIKTKKNFFKSFIIRLLPILGFYYRVRERIENKFL